MFYKLIGCKIMEREIASVTYNCKNYVDVTLIQQKLHSRPSKLHAVLQEEIDMIDQEAHRYSNHVTDRPYDAILLGYGLCAGIIENLQSEKYPIVIPKVHDCISLLLGSREAYDAYYKDHTGTFYYSPGFVEIDDVPNMDNRWERRYLFHLNRHKGNERKARRLVEIEKSLTASYTGAAYIHWDELDFPEYEKKVQSMTEEKGWTFSRLEGNNSFLRKLVDGDWNEEEFLVVPPKHYAEQSFDKNIIKVHEE